MSNDRSRGWRLIYTAPKHGLRFFVRTIGDEREGIPRVAVADNSGSTPDATEDGILWVDLDRPWYVRDHRFDIPVTRDRDERKLWTVASCEALFDLLAVLRLPEDANGLGERALRIKCQLANDGGIGARAILRCLALGIDPTKE